MVTYQKMMLKMMQATPAATDGGAGAIPGTRFAPIFVTP
jgi:hypothetical protein